MKVCWNSCKENGNDTFLFFFLGCPFIPLDSNGSRLLCQNAADRSFVGVAHIELVVLLIGRAQINGFRVICLCGSCGRLSRCGSHIVVLLVLVAGAAGTALHQQYDQQDQNQKNCQNPVIPDAAAFTLRLL